MERIVERARELAIIKHGGMHSPDQALTPMMEHIREVVALVKSQGGTCAMIAAAWLHDVVEDSDVARRIVMECQGLWPAPDERFDAAYATARRRYTRE